MRINESLVKYLKNLKKFTKTQLSFSNYIIPIKPVCFTIGFINKTKINLDIINPKVIDDVLISMKDEAPNTNLFLVWNRFGIAQIVRELSSIDEFFTSGKFAILNVKPGDSFNIIKKEDGEITYIDESLEGFEDNVISHLQI